MRRVVLGYASAPGSPDRSRQSIERFRRRTADLGLAVSIEHAAHAVACAPAPAARPERATGEWQVVHFDGMLHGRDGLAVHGARPASASDADLMEPLLTRHGPAALGWIVGDWAIAAISPAALLLAVDHFANRALFYHRSGDGALVWSNHDWLIAEYLERSEDLDRSYFAGLLYFVPPPGHTPYREISAVPPGHVVAYRDGRIDVQPHWFPRHRRIRLADSREYARAFFDLLRDGVRERLAAPGAKWVEISGGIDSALVAACVRDGERTASSRGRIEAVHYTTERPESSADTRRARETASQHGLALRTYSHEAMLHDASKAAIDDPRETLGAFREVTRRAHAEGVSVLLSGRLGDLVTGNCEPEPRHLIDLWRRKGPGVAARALYAWAVFSEVTVWTILSRLAHDCLRSRWDANLSRKLARHRDEQRALLAGELDEVVSRWRIALQLPDRDLLSDPEAWWWFGVHTLRLSGSYRGAWSRSACDRTYPFSHRPLLEFIAACPWDEIFDATHPRRLVHEQMTELLPRSLAGSIIKSDTGAWRAAPLRELWVRTLGADARRSSLTVEAALCDAAELERVDNAFRLGQAARMALGLRLLQTELWLRSRPRRHAAMSANTKGGEYHAVREA
jgi:asparagine synthetase B (glutamine-hydrolysing)